MSRRVPGSWKRFGLTVLRVFVLGVVVAGGFVFEARKDAGGDIWPGFAWAWFFALLGGVLIIAGIAAQVLWGWRVDLTEARNTHDAANFQVAMKDALKPVLAKVSEMPDMPVGEREAHLKVVADAAAWALSTLLLRHVDSARTGVYGMSANGDALRVVGYGGRGERPGEFLAGRTAADLALQRVKNGEILIIDDRTVEGPPGWDRETAEWLSFVSIPIVSNDGYSFGMLNVDSPSARQFGDIEKQIVSVVAEILAIAFALTYPLSGRS
ncbi:MULTISPECIES: GAF domain-containing protein [unclassified Leifsonia]|uniref:GAF domain-containing protein n=1 Tax=unclassified Leifsonia TaxID=2663824 RepID=UPI0012FD62C1|nr:MULTISPECIES: GAF domain-containing protein [unclassified Leifsonia]